MKRALLFSAALALAACGGGSSTGGGTADSPFVGTYKGSSRAAVSASAGTRTAGESISIFVHRDGLIQLGDAGSTIYVSGPLNGDRIHLEGDAAVLVDPDCSGTVVLSGTFTTGNNDSAAFQGNWSSDDVSCFGVSGELGGPVTAQRVNREARTSRVFETNSPALLEAFQRAVD